MYAIDDFIGQIVCLVATVGMMKHHLLLITAGFMIGLLSCVDCFPLLRRPALICPTSDLSSIGKLTYLRSTLKVSKDSENVVDRLTKKTVQSFLSSLFILSTVAVSGMTPPGLQSAEASDSRLIGEIPGSGIFFKDILNVESFDDPKVKVCKERISSKHRVFPISHLPFESNFHWPTRE